MSFLSKWFGRGVSADEESKGSITVLSPDQYKDRIQQEKPLRLIDVRTPAEYNSGHITGARNIDVMNPIAFEQKLSTMEKESPVYLYCRSGQRSRNAARRMLKMGFREVYDLKGGYMAWR